MASVATRASLPRDGKGKAPSVRAPSPSPAAFPFDEALNDLMQLIPPHEDGREQPLPPKPAANDDDMLTKIIQQTVHTTKPPSNFSLKDDQLQQMLALRPPTAATRPPTPESKVTLWDTQRRCRVSGAAAPAPKDLEAFLRENKHMQVYANQDSAPSSRPAAAPVPVAEVRVTVWDALQGRKLTGSEAPTEKELALFLQRHPHCEVYCGQRAPPVSNTNYDAAEGAPLKPGHAHEGAPAKSNFLWVDKPLAGKWDKPLKPRPADLAPKRPTEGSVTVDPSLLAKRARVEPPAVAAAPAPAAAPPAAAPPAAAPAVAATAAAPDAAPAATPDGPGVIFVPLVVSSFAAVAEQMGAYMSHPAVRRSLAALAQGPGGDTQMPMPFIPLSSLGGAAQKGAAAPAAAAAASEESDHLLASLLDAAGADQLPGSDGPLCISSLFDDSECATLCTALSHSNAPAPAPPASAHRLSAGGRPAPAPPARAGSRAAAAGRPAAAMPSSSSMALQRGPALTVPPSAFTIGECGYPYCENKGWFAFNESGKGIFLLERLFLMLSMPQQPLCKHPGKRMRDAIRWMDRATADANGVPAGSVGFELVDPTLFSDEVYPQWRSGSFRKTAKHWGLTSPKPKQHSVRKLTPKCMYLPVHEEQDQAAVDLEGVFKPLPPNGGQAALADYVKNKIRPLEESIKAKASASAARSSVTVDPTSLMMDIDDALLPLTPSPPAAQRAPASHTNPASQAATNNNNNQEGGLKWHCNTVL